MQVTLPEIRENGQNQSLHHKETRYSAEDVRLILDTSLTDSTVSETGSEDEQSSDIDSSTEYDLSDPEAGLNTEDDEFYTRRPVGKAATNWANWAVQVMIISSKTEKKHFHRRSIIPVVILIVMVVRMD